MLIFYNMAWYILLIMIMKHIFCALAYTRMRDPVSKINKERDRFMSHGRPMLMLFCFHLKG